MSAGPTSAPAPEALCAAWWRLERSLESAPAAVADGDWMEVHAALIASRGSGAQPSLPKPCPPALEQWARLPAGMRDLLVLRELGGLPLETFAERWALSPEAPTRAFRAAAGALEDACGPDWAQALRASFVELASPARPAGLLRAAAPSAGIEAPVSAPGLASPPPQGVAVEPAGGPAAPLWSRARWALAAALAIGLLALAGLLKPPPDPVQTRLQAPPAPSFIVEETVPLSSPDFGLWADDVDFALLDALELLLWRAQQAGLGLAGEPQALVAGLPLPSPAESAVLAPWAGAWAGLDPARQALLSANAARWDALDDVQRARFEQRREAFGALPPLQRTRLRERSLRWGALPAVTQDALRALWADFQQAPPAVQARLREDFQQLPDAVRRGLLAGKAPELAATARAAFGFVPEDVRESTLDMLRSLDEAELRLLEAMGARLDGSGRERLREELLAAPAAERGERVRSAARRVGLGP